MSDPLRRAGALGGQLALAPLRALGAVSEPVRADIARDVRRSLGLAEGGRPAVMDAGAAFLPPGGMARSVHSDLPSMLIGGLAALLLQTLHPLAMAGVADHSNYHEDAVRRLRRTAFFVGVTTFGTAQEARRAIEEVKAVHHRVRGVSPDGRPYAAGDPELVTWVHVAELAMFLAAAQRFGPRRYSPEECDRYYDENALVAYELGAEWAPRRVTEAEAYFQRMRPELYGGRQALDARNFLLRGVARRPEDRLIYTVVAGAAVSLLPGWARLRLRIPAPPVLDPLLAVPVARAMSAGLRWAVAEGPLED